MSNFLDELKDSVLSCDMEEKLPHRWVDNHEMVGSAIGMIDSLGENARRMLEIGILQDELVKLGFENFSPYISCFILPKIMIDFDVDRVRLIHQNISFNYKSLTWQEDLINKVKELIK